MAFSSRNNLIFLNLFLAMIFFNFCLSTYRCMSATNKTKTYSWPDPPHLIQQEVQPKFDGDDAGSGTMGFPLSSPELRSINDWLYILNLDRISIDQIASSGFDMVVMDYESSATGEFSQEDIARIHNSGKIVIAYLSIGEAENYRFYWQPSWNDSPPTWLGPENPNWEGNFKVRYWEPEWKSILFGTPNGENKSYLDRIIDQGFDGIYLDIIDAFEYWSEEENEITRQEARLRMKNLVHELRDYALNTRNLNYFYIIPQNGSAIVVNDDWELDDLGLEYLHLCDGLGAEDTWYDEINPLPTEQVEEGLFLLDVFKSETRSQTVLTVDYIWNQTNPTDGINIDRFNRFHALSLEHGFTPYAANQDRALQDIITQIDTDKFMYTQPKTNATNTNVQEWNIIDQ